MTTPALTVRSLLSQDNVKSKFEEILRDRAAGFTANLAVMVNNSAALSKCDPMTVISAAVVAASLDLPLDPNLGFAAVVPFGDKASFQIMYKGILQLAIRSGQYKYINVTEIYEGELVSENRVTGRYVFNNKKRVSDKIIGYAAYFKLNTGFEKTLYWSVSEIEKHGLRYSQTFKRGSGLWKENFEAMARKTVLKTLLSKWGILSVEMQSAVKFDQGVIRDVENGVVEYLDNDPIEAAFDNDEPVKAKRVQTVIPQA